MTAHNRSEVRRQVTEEVVRVLEGGPATASDIADSIDMPEGASRDTVHSVLWYLKSRDRLAYSMATKLYGLKAEPSRSAAGSRLGSSVGGSAPPPPPRSEQPPAPSKLTGHGRPTAAPPPPPPAEAPSEEPPPATEAKEPAAPEEDDEQEEHGVEETWGEEPAEGEDDLQVDPALANGYPTETEPAPAPPTPASIDLDVPRFLDGLDVDPEEERRRRRQVRARLLIQASDLRIHAAQLLEDEAEH